MEGSPKRPQLPRGGPKAPPPARGAPGAGGGTHPPTGSGLNRAAARETAVPESVTHPTTVSVWNGSGPGQTEAPAADGAAAAPAGAAAPTASGASVTVIDWRLVPEGLAARMPSSTLEK